MKIEFRHKQDSSGEITIFVDGEPWREVHRSIFGRRPSIPKGCESLNELNEQFAEIEYRAAFLYALRRLSLKAHHITELKKNLETRLVSPSATQQVITECQRLGYLNDQEWLESFVRGNLAKNLGPHAILRKLRARGFSYEMAAQVLQSLDNAESQKDRVLHLLNTRFRSKDLSDYHTKEKVFASLIRKGFPLSEIHSALKIKVKG